MFFRVTVPYFVEDCEGARRTGCKGEAILSVLAGLSAYTTRDARHYNDRTLVRTTCMGGGRRPHPSTIDLTGGSLPAPR